MKSIVRILVLVVVVLSGVSAVAAPLVLGKRYPLNSKADRGTLVWQFVTFNRSISGGINIQLEVYNSRAKSIKFFDEYRDIVNESIQKNTISKFSMESSSINFSSDRYAIFSFQVSKLSNLYYIPLRVDYHDGFEDYLVRLYFAKGKFAMASRLLQQGKFLNVDEEAALAAEESSKKKKDKKKDKKKGKKTEADQQPEASVVEETPSSEALPVSVDTETAESQEEVDEPTVKIVPVKEPTPEELKAAEEFRSFLEESPDEDSLSEMPEFKSDLNDPQFEDTSDIMFNEADPSAPEGRESSEDESSYDLSFPENTEDSTAE